MHVSEIVREAVQEINLRLPKNLRFEATPSVVLLGAGSSLDSAAFLDFLLILEQKLEASTGRPVSLVDDAAFDPATGPLRTIGTLQAHLESLLKEPS